MTALANLLGRTLVLVAHPDDESIGCGALLQRISDPIVVFATDGAPDDSYFWKKYGSREELARLRRQEVEAAMNAVGVKRWDWLRDDSGEYFKDQTIFQRIPEVVRAAARAVEQYRPQAILASAYEGGHPDHDTCCFVASQLEHRLQVPAWEMPLYHRDANGKGVLQRFLCWTGEEIEIAPTEQEKERKRAMCEAYVSQGVISLVESSTREFVRPMAEYEYSQRPHEGALNYELWQWTMTGQQVANAFREYLESGVDKAA